MRSSGLNEINLIVQAMNRNGDPMELINDDIPWCGPTAQEFRNWSVNATRPNFPNPPPIVKKPMTYLLRKYHNILKQDGIFHPELDQ